jgi:hypothetical protein
MAVSTEERLAHLEGAYEHLATKADVERVQANMERLRGDVERAINTQTWKLVGVQLLIGGVIVGVLKLL